MIESYFVEVLHYLFLKQQVWSQSDAGNSPEFHKIFDEPVRKFDDNVITISAFLICVDKQPLLGFNTRLDKSPPCNLFVGVQCNYCNSGLFLSEFVCSFKVFFYYLFFTEKQFPLEILFLFVM